MERSIVDCARRRVDTVANDIRIVKCKFSWMGLDE